MRIAILSNSDLGYDFLKEHLTFREIEKNQGLEYVKGKLQNQWVLVVNSRNLESQKFLELLALEEISHLLSLGFVEQSNAPLVPGDVLVAGQVETISIPPKLVDWCLAAVDECEDLADEKVVVGALSSSLPSDIVDGDVFGVDGQAGAIAVTCERRGLDAFFIRIFKGCQEEELDQQFYSECQQKFFWLVKGILDQINKYRHTAI